mmetsp:Transcript_28203/g.90687  ORF Transcript_28203/g.90687 Transcript_28203/m.90687 type:complete len:105 (-) Transcript_28203:61-375(-)
MNVERCTENVWQVFGVVARAGVARAVQPLLRAEGDATVHSSRLLHAVSAMTGGTRYALILFFDRRARAGRRTRWSTPAAAVSKVEGRDAFSVRVSGGGVGQLLG